MVVSKDGLQVSMDADPASTPSYAISKRPVPSTQISYLKFRARHEGQLKFGLLSDPPINLRQRAQQSQFTEFRGWSTEAYVFRDRDEQCDGGLGLQSGDECILQFNPGERTLRCLELTSGRHATIWNLNLMEVVHMRWVFDIERTGDRVEILATTPEDIARMDEFQ